MQDLSTQLTLDPNTQALLANPAALVAALASGQVRGIRVTVEALFNVGAGPLDAMPTAAPAAVPGTAGNESELPDLSNLVWETLAADKLSYRWPKRAGEPDSTERYEEAYRTRVLVGKTTKTVVIGLTNRKAAGKNDRRRAIVFFGEPPAIYPIVEAAGANDFETSGQLASAIKLPDGKYLKPGAPVPPEYAGLPLDLYTRIVQGPNAVNSMAVVVTVHHRDEMLRLLTLHALIRAKWKGSL